MMMKSWNSKAAKHLQLLALHGFTGCKMDFNPIAAVGSEYAHWHAIDLPGHGNCLNHPKPEIYELEGCLGYIKEAEEELRLSKYTLLGYSMGGRLALHYALKYQHQLNGLVLISASPGIESKADRLKRKKDDYDLSQKIQKETMEAFTSFWQAHPMIASQQNIPTEIYDDMVARRRNNSPIGLAKNLNKLGSGNLVPLWNRLGELQLPVLLVTGGNDDKYCELSKKMTSKIDHVSSVVLPGVGHTCHLEDVNSFVDALNEFLIKMR